jgi:glycosyltransferase involved in cell wall biosynthesis
MSASMPAPDAVPPFVSVILPVRNEGDFIGRCLRSLLANDYPADRFELLVVDGQSTDNTRAVVAALAAQGARVQVLDNPARIVPHAMNTGIRAARGEIIIRVDGHAEVEPDFIAASVRELRARPDCWCVGGPIETINTDTVGRSIAAAMSTPVGVGNAMFRLGNFEGYVDTIAFGAYWRWTFDRMGLFDEELVRNQDDELNARLIQHGGKIFMCRSIRSRYYPRTSLRKLWRQYYQYGFWRIRTIQKAGKPATPRQLAPLAFVLGLAVLVLASSGLSPARWLLGGYVALYALGLAAGTAQVIRRAGLGAGLLAPLVFAILHFAYGLGSLHGIVHFVLLRRRPARPEDHALSR